jgi:chromosome segregation ATPase
MSKYFRSMMKKTSKVFGPDDEEHTPPPNECLFQPASSSLDIMLQARENLIVFRTYLESDPTDSQGCYDVVYQTMSRAFSQFTNRTAELEGKLLEAQTAANDFSGQEQLTRQRRASFLDRLAALEAAAAGVRPEIDAAHEETSRLEAEIRGGKERKRRLAEGRRAYDGLQVQLAAAEAEFVRQKEATRRRQQDLADVRRAVERQARELEDELAASDARIRELTVRVKQVEAEDREVQLVKRRTSPTPAKDGPKQSTYVINDSVRVSQQELEQLRFMVEAIQAENEKLAEQVESRMMDADCLLQENCGLKQVIRLIVEGK